MADTPRIERRDLTSAATILFAPVKTGSLPAQITERIRGRLPFLIGARARKRGSLAAA